MFLPVKKNLQIGLGLVNALTVEELKAILSHEFGHFSQQTMAVGSYVYNVNQIIFNTLYDNESYQKLIQKWADVSGYFYPFVALAVKINSGIQWILQKLYNVVNISYLGLSREMEFHADEIAAQITGCEPAKNALLRTPLADYAFNNVLDFYNRKIADNLRSENLYKDQISVMKILAEINNIPLKNDLPYISLEEQSKFDKSKLVIKNQWASHPTDKERITKLLNTGILYENNKDNLANSIFKNIEETQKQLTNKLFESVNYQAEVKFISFEDFQKEYKNNVLSNSFSKIYNGYYDYKSPSHFKLTKNNLTNGSYDIKELFSDNKVNLIYTSVALQNDLEILKNISNNSIPAKTFDYDGVRYRRKDINTLLGKLNTEFENLNEQIKQNDISIYEYFEKIEREQNGKKKLEGLYCDFFEYDENFNSKYSLYTQLLNELQFVNTTLPFDIIRANLNKIEPIEENLKVEIGKILSDSFYQTEITDEMKQGLKSYTAETLEYFRTNQYNEKNLNILYTAMNTYAYLLSRGYFLMKKNLLAYQEEIVKNSQR
jgi:hypothetical protein